MSDRVFSSEDPLAVIAERRSVKPANLGDPAPDDAALAELLQASMSAPDHGAIRPWRFRIIRGESRHALSDLFENALRLRDPDADEHARATLRSKPLRAPLIVAVGAEVMENHPKVPREEQIVAAACATQNLLLAAHIKGWGAILLTGWMAHDITVKKGLGFKQSDALIGFVYMGTTTETPREMARPDVKSFTEIWPSRA